MVDSAFDALKGLANKIVLRDGDEEIAVVPTLIAEIDRLRDQLHLADQSARSSSAEAARLGRILAALREPSATVVDETWNAFDEYDGEMSGLIRHTIHAAVAAAEQEVGRE